MNILILNWRDPKNPKSGGAEIVTLEHAKAWVKNGNTVTWFTSKFPQAKTQESLNGVRIVRGGNFISVYLLAPIFYLFTKNKFDLVIDEIHGLPFFTPLYVRKPKIAFIHEVAGEIWDFMWPFPINAIGKFLEPLYFKFYKNVKFWTDADSTVNDLVKYGIPINNCTVINCPIDRKPLKSIPSKETAPTFIFVSRVVQMKGVEDVIKAFLYIQKELKDAQFWIVGDGDKNYIEKLKKIIKFHSINSKVKFWGRVDENKKFELLRKAHLLLHASVKEGWGLVVIEAASQATPAIVYNVAGLRDSVKNGKTGIVLEKNTASEMAAQTIKLIKNKSEYARLQKNALAWSKSLTWENATKESFKLISNL
jgi:glycosyltransferase involved in cell wall biosynthesis